MENTDGGVALLAAVGAVAAGIVVGAAIGYAGYLAIEYAEDNWF